MFFDLRSFSNAIYVTTDFTIGTGISFFCYNFKSQFHRKFTEDDLLDIYIMQLLTPDFKLYNVFYTQVCIIQETLR